MSKKVFDINNIQLTIQSPDIKIEETLQNYLIDNIENLGKVFSGINKCELILRVERGKPKKCITEAKIFVPGNILFAKKHQGSFKVAAHKIFVDLRGQLLQYKEKLQN